jgi:hypothetical protein
MVNGFSAAPKRKPPPQQTTASNATAAKSFIFDFRLADYKRERAHHKVPFAGMPRPYFEEVARGSVQNPNKTAVAHRLLFTFTVRQAL